MNTARTAVMSAAVLTALVTAPAFASTPNFSGLAGVYNTGASSANNSAPTQFADQAQDTYWTVSGPGLTGAQTAYVTDTSSYPFPAWPADTAESKWISPQPTYGNHEHDQHDPSTFTYTTTFSVLSGYNASLGTIAGAFAADNHVSAITLNGVTHAIDPTTNDYHNFTNFSFTGLQSGTNTLSFTVINDDDGADNPTGINVKFDGALSNAAPTPEGSTMLSMVLLTAGGLFLVMKGRKRTAPSAA